MQLNKTHMAIKKRCKVEVLCKWKNKQKRHRTVAHKEKKVSKGAAKNKYNLRPIDLRSKK
jgi:hypothetical protein